MAPNDDGEKGQANLQSDPPRWLPAASAALMGGLMGLLIDALLLAGWERNKH